MAIAAGLSFYVLCMILPLVGPSGSRVAHAARNRATFLSVLLLTLVLSVASTVFSLRRRKAQGGAFPRVSLGLSVVCLLFLVILFSNGFSI